MVDQDWPLALTYGATEMTSQITTAAPDETKGKPGAVGRPLFGVQVRVADGGEISARGPTRAVGYVGEEDKALAGADGWYLTGDLGRLDGDGDLWITGRRMDRIVSGGMSAVHAPLGSQLFLGIFCDFGIDHVIVQIRSGKFCECPSVSTPRTSARLRRTGLSQTV